MLILQHPASADLRQADLRQEIIGAVSFFRRVHEVSFVFRNHRHSLNFF